MRTALKKTFNVVLYVLCCFWGQAQLQITPETNGLALAQRLVGDGITISNVQVSGSPLSTGFFKNLGGTQLNLDSGIVLSTGRVLTTGTNWGVNAPATNLASTSHSGPGDAMLNALLGADETNDATVLEFDFRPIGDTVRFRYVFSSDEYPTFVCSDFNDIFAFFISGPGIVGTKNIALVPGTNIPVAINSINDGTDSDLDGLCAGMGPGSPFPQYFINNETNIHFSMDGHTVVLTATAVVQPCQTYHLKMAIADVFDWSWDSNVFIEARSLISTPLKIFNQNPVANGLPYMVEGCTAGSIRISRLQALSSPQVVNLFFTGTATNGVDVVSVPTSVTIPANDSIVMVPINPVADNTLEGIENIKILISYEACGVATNFYSDSITIQIRDQLSALSSTVSSGCDAPAGTLSMTVPSSSGAPGYQYSINGGNFQSGNTFSGLLAGNYMVSVKDTSGCTFSSVVTVPLNNTLTVDVFPTDTSMCAGATFRPRAVTNYQTADFSWTPSSGIAGAPVPGQPFIPNITVGSQNTAYIVTATQGQCQTTDTVQVSVFTGATSNAGTDRTIIVGDQVQLQGSGTSGTYAWTPTTGILSGGNTLTPTVSPTATTTYTLTVTSPLGCVASDNVTVNVVPYCVKPMEAFTPNGDGINDYWLISNGGCLSFARAEVFNRYGHKVYESREYKNNWDGTYKGSPLPDGTYYFIITYQLINGKTVYQRGNVTILR